ncbi:hypothetical protein L208DRAFT_1396951 [Tricholoma matsutake]|nr:hypothetical protein L208DRAFT_1396951 [Tricholoma matsutake 945]
MFTRDTLVVVPTFPRGPWGGYIQAISLLYPNSLILYLRIAMLSPELLPAPLRELRVLIMFWLLVVPRVKNIEAAAAPITSCDSYSYAYTCPEADNNGYVLMGSPYALPPEGSYSIFDCVYGLPKTETKPHTCHYYKVSGEYGLGSEHTSCPRQAPTCLAVGAPRFSALEKEELTWVENGRHLLWLKEHHT